MSAHATRALFLLIVLVTAHGCSEPAAEIKPTVESKAESFGVSWVDTSRPLRATSFISAEEGWAVGDAGLILTTRDAGQSWTSVENPNRENYTSVHFVSQTTGWIASTTGTVLRTKDRGITWEAQTVPGQGIIRGVWFADTLKGWAVTYGGAVLSTNNGGESWLVQAQTPNQSWRALFFADSRHGFAVGQKGNIFETTDGEHWRLRSSGVSADLLSIRFSTPAIGCAAGIDGSLVVTRDGGTNWKSLDPHTQSDLHDCLIKADGRIWAIGSEGMILHSPDGGTSWERQSSGEGLQLWSIKETPGGALWIAGELATLLESSDRGSHWIIRQGGIPKTLNSVSFTSAGHGWALGHGGLLLESTDRGGTWVRRFLETHACLHAAAFVGEERGWIAGADGLILSTKDAGETWVSQVSGTNEALHSISFVDKEYGWAVGNGGRILHTVDAGKAWIPQTSETTAKLLAVHFISRFLGVAVGREGTILHTKDGGTTWQPIAADAIEFSSVWMHADGGFTVVGAAGTILKFHPSSGIRKIRIDTNAYISSIHFSGNRGRLTTNTGLVFASENYGESWKSENVENSASLSSIHIVNERISIAAGDGIFRTNDDGEGWYLYSPIYYGTYFDHSGMGWIVGEGGTVLGSTDGGNHWSARITGVAALLRRIHFHDQLRGVIGGETGALLITTDGGQQWAQVTALAKYIYGVFAGDKYFWAALGRGALLKCGWTTRSCTDALGPEDTRGVALSDVLFLDDDTGWVVGDRNTVFRTKDGGTKWERVAVPDVKSDLQRIAFVDSKAGWIVGTRGVILATRDSGKTWTTQSSGVSAPLQDVYFANRNTGWAVGDGVILETADGGRSWSSSAMARTEMQYMGVSYVPGAGGAIVGMNQTLLRAGAIDRSPGVSQFQVSPQANNVRIEWEVADDRQAPIEMKSLEFRAWNDGAWMPVNAPIENVGSNTFRIVWNPSARPYGIASGTELSYRLALSDGRTRITREITKVFVYQTWWARRSNATRSAIAGAAWFGVWAIIVGFTLAISPPSLLTLALPLRGVRDVVAKSSHVGEAIDLAVELVLLGPALRARRTRAHWCQRAASSGRIDIDGLPARVWRSYAMHDDVRLVWARAIERGSASLEQLDVETRAAFMRDTRILDAWVARVCPSVRERFKLNESVKQRALYIPLPVRIGEGDGLWRSVLAPTSQDIAPLFRGGPNIVELVGIGGTGKSTLAWQISTWALSERVDERLFEYITLPVVVDGETANLAELIQRRLDFAIGGVPGTWLDQSLVRALLQTGRLMPIVDGLSERSPATRTAIKDGLEALAPLATVVTSRAEEQLAIGTVSYIRPERLTEATLTYFVAEYLPRTGTKKAVRGRDMLRIAERVLDLVETRSDLFVTPLVIRLFLDRCIPLIDSDIGIDSAPRTVPDTILDYVVSVTRSVSDAPDQTQTLAAARILARLSLETDYRPKVFSAIDARAKLGQAGLELRTLDVLLAAGVLRSVGSTGLNWVCFDLDPVAEYLGAIDLAERCRLREIEIGNVIHLLQQTEQPREIQGFVAALRDTWITYTESLRLPSLQFASLATPSSP